MEKNNSDEQRRELAKFFYDLAKATFTAMVLGAVLALFGFSKNNTANCIVSIITGVISTFGFAYTANKINRKK